MGGLNMGEGGKTRVGAGYLYMIPYQGDGYYLAARPRETDKYGHPCINHGEDLRLDELLPEEWYGKKVRVTVELMEE